MPFDWKNLLDLARQMEQEASKSASNDETLCRSAVGRAYFAAFCHARNYSEQFLSINPRTTNAIMARFALTSRERGAKGTPTASNACGNGEMRRTT
jgi:hypothetical protein